MNQDITQLEQDRARRAEIRGVIAMSIPMVITFSSRAVMDVVDFVMITRLNDPEAQAAILPAQIVMWMYIVVGFGIVSIINTFAAQSLGREKYRECSAFAWQAMYLAMFFGLVGWACSPIIPRLIAASGHEPGVASLELAYANVAIYSIAPTIASYGLGWFFVGIHRPWTTMWSAIEANVVNTAVSYVLIFGCFGVEPMGIAGAAWGTVAAVTYRMVRLLLTLLAPKMARTFHTRETWRPAWKPLWSLLRVGAPCGLQWICDVAVWAIFVNVLVGAKFGTAHLIATNTAWQFLRVSFMPTWGLGQALTALVGKSIGARQLDRAMRETRVMVLITLAYIGTLSIVYAVFGATLIGWFSDDPEVIRIGQMVMWCAAVFQLFDAMGIIYNCALRGAGDTFIPSLFFIVANWVIIVGGGWLMVSYFPELGSIGPWIAASLLIIVLGLFLRFRWNGRAWQRINLFASDAAAPTPTPVEERQVAATVAGDA